MVLVVACAGRRIDAEGLAVGERCFPLTNVIKVRRRLKCFFEEERPRVLVCSAACGADLLALDVAGEMGLRCRVVLPFGPERFRNTSVTDRPSDPHLGADWGAMFDQVIDVAQRVGDLVVLSTTSVNGDTAAYSVANRSIISEAADIAGALPRAYQVPLGLVIWNGKARQSADATEEFRKLTAAAGFTQRELRTD